MKNNWFKETDWISIIVIGIMISCVTIATQYYFNIQTRECVNNPLVYSAKYFEEKYGYPFQGSGSFILSGNKISPIIFFNSYNITLQQPIINQDRGAINISIDDLRKFLLNHSS